MFGIFAQTLRIASRQDGWSPDVTLTRAEAHKDVLPQHWRRKEDEYRKQQRLQLQARRER